MRFKRTAELVSSTRKQLGLTQGALAKILGYNSPMSISNIERGDVGISPKRILDFSIALRIPTSAIIQSAAIDAMETLRGEVESQLEAMGDK